MGDINLCFVEVDDNIFRGRVSLTSENETTSRNTVNCRLKGASSYTIVRDVRRRNLFVKSTEDRVTKRCLGQRVFHEQSFGFFVLLTDRRVLNAMVQALAR